jgi:hypothetical protein
MYMYMYYTDYIKFLLLGTYYHRKQELETFSLGSEIDVFNSYSMRVYVVIRLPVEISVFDSWQRQGLFFLHHCVQTSYEYHVNSYPIVIRGICPGGKTAGT